MLQTDMPQVDIPKSTSPRRHPQVDIPKSTCPKTATGAVKFGLRSAGGLGAGGDVGLRLAVKPFHTETKAIVLFGLVARKIFRNVRFFAAV